MFCGPFYFISFYFVLFYFILFCFLVLFLLNNPIIQLSSLFIMNCGIHTNRKWNYGHMGVLSSSFVSCSLTIEEVERHSSPLKYLFN